MPPAMKAPMPELAVVDEGPAAARVVVVVAVARVGPVIVVAAARLPGPVVVVVAGFGARRRAGLAGGRGGDAAGELGVAVGAFHLFADQRVGHAQLAAAVG